MNLRIVSLIGYTIAVIAAVYLWEVNCIFSNNPITITIQICSVGLMIWARITFGRRSFHAAANTTEGELVTSGPYRWLRHPVYASIIYFFLACLIPYPFIKTFVGIFLICGGLFVRMIIEEKFLLVAYAEYADYSKRTKRVIPFLF